QPPHHISNLAHVENSMITEGCEVDGTVEFSVIFANVKIGAGAVVRDSIIMPGAVIEEGAQVHYSIVAENVTIKKDAIVGARPECMTDLSQWGVTVLGEGITVGAGARVQPKSMLTEDVKEVR
ncbi:MAG: glucose-1-phosphate adenylyltransferase, partial [Pygmaiobacter massiliensis]